MRAEAGNMDEASALFVCVLIIDDEEKPLMYTAPMNATLPMIVQYAFEYSKMLPLTL